MTKPRLVSRIFTRYIAPINSHRFIAPGLLLILLVIILSINIRASNSPNAEIPNLSCELATDQSCQQKFVESVVKTRDLGAAYDKIEQAFLSHPDFSVNCHPLAHKLGETTYKLFSDNVKFSLSAKASDCNWGFYHGFMDAFVQSRSSPEQARKFCDYVDSQLRQVSSGSVFACYHGIGHGSANNHDPRYWGNAHAMAQSSLAACSAVASSAINLSMCASGVFMGLNEFASSQQYQLSINKSDPLFLCREFSGLSQLACYSQSYVLLDKLTNRNLEQAAIFIAGIGDDTNANEAMRTMASAVVKIDEGISSIIHSCHAVAIRVRQACIDGLALGTIEKASPDRAVDLSLSVCGSSQLSDDEAEGCFRQIISQTKTMFDSRILGATCQKITDSFRSLCQN